MSVAGWQEEAKAILNCNTLETNTFLGGVALTVTSEGGRQTSSSSSSTTSGGSSSSTTSGGSSNEINSTTGVGVGDLNSQGSCLLGKPVRGPLLALPAGFTGKRLYNLLRPEFLLQYERYVVIYIYYYYNY